MKRVQVKKSFPFWELAMVTDAWAEVQLFMMVGFAGLDHSDATHPGYPEHRQVSISPEH